MGQVNLSESAEKSLVEKLAKAVAEQQQLALLEQLKQYALTEANLTRAREDIARKDAEIASLQARLNQLSGLLTYAPAGAPIATTYPVPTFDQRYVVQVPAPQQFAPPVATSEPASPAPAAPPAGS